MSWIGRWVTVALMMLASSVGLLSSALALQDVEGSDTGAPELTPLDVRARLDAILLREERLSLPEMAATWDAAGSMPGMGFWEDLFKAARRVSRRHALGAYLAAFRLKPEASAERVLREIGASRNSEDITRSYYAVRVMGIYPELDIEKRLSAVIDEVKKRGPEDGADRDWPFKVASLESQVQLIRILRPLHEEYCRASSVDEKMKFLITRPELFARIIDLTWGHHLTGSWLQRVFVELAEKEPFEVAAWLTRISAKELGERVGGPGVEHSKEVLSKRVSQLVDKLPAEARLAYRRLAK